MSPSSVSSALRKFQKHYENVGGGGGWKPDPGLHACTFLGVEVVQEMRGNPRVKTPFMVFKYQLAEGEEEGREFSEKLHLVPPGKDPTFIPALTRLKFSAAVMNGDQDIPEIDEAYAFLEEQAGRSCVVEIVPFTGQSGRGGRNVFVREAGPPLEDEGTDQLPVMEGDEILEEVPEPGPGPEEVPAEGEQTTFEFPEPEPAPKTVRRKGRKASR
jgi:hypothetical protein